MLHGHTEKILAYISFGKHLGKTYIKLNFYNMCHSYYLLPRAVFCVGASTLQTAELSDFSKHFIMEANSPS